MSRKDGDPNFEQERERAILKARRNHKRLPKRFRDAGNTKAPAGEARIQAPGHAGPGLSGKGGNAAPTEGDLIRYGILQINDSEADPKLRFQYWDRLGQYMRLWGPKASTRKPQEPVGFDIEGDAANLP